MNKENLDELRGIVRKLVNIANGEKQLLTPREAYVAVKVFDLVEPIIYQIEDSLVFAGAENRRNKW